LIIWKAVAKLESLGFKFIFFIRKSFQISRLISY
jgi:hypothetical protein